MSQLIALNDEPKALGKAEIYDLYKLDMDAKKAFGGMGFFPKVYGDILERYFTIGEIDIVKANETLANFYRAKDETFYPESEKSEPVTENTAEISDIC